MSTTTNGASNASAEQDPDKLSRQRLAKDAALDIDLLLTMMRKQTRASDDPEELELMLVASFHHMSLLNNVVLCALSDDNRFSVEEMKEMVHG